jgi:hypothetical protein
VKAGAVQKEGLTQKIDFKIFTDSVIPDAIWNVEQF